MEYGGVGGRDLVGSGEVSLSEVKSGQQANKNLVTSIVGLCEFRKKHEWETWGYI
jgi:hypothetical protein